MKKKCIFGLNRFEIMLWLISVAVISLSFIICSSSDWVSLVASIIGITSLIFLAKGYVIGQILIIIFSVFYGIVSFYSRYYGEMITYLCMTTPMAIAALIQWIKNPFQGTKEVEISKLTKKHIAIMSASAVAVTIAFYFILKLLGNASLIVSTLSITTSFFAAYMTAARSPYYALGYACNDIVLVVLWIVASVKNPNCIPMVSCFAMFLVNDLYGFYSWKKMEKRQKRIKKRKNDGI